MSSPTLESVKAFVARFDGTIGLSHAEEELMYAVLQTRTSSEGKVNYRGALADLERMKKAWTANGGDVAPVLMTNMAAAIRTTVHLEPPAKESVKVKVYWDGPSKEPVVVDMPGTAFYWKEGKPLGLKGARVAIQSSEANTGWDGGVKHFFDDLKPNIEGDFVNDEQVEALGQTTAFFAAHQVLNLVEASTGRPLKWGGNGRLNIDPYSFVTPLATGLNAFFNYESQSLSFGSWASIEGGALKPYVGRGLEFYQGAFDEVDGLIQETKDAIAALPRSDSPEKLLADLENYTLLRARLEALKALASRGNIAPEVFAAEAEALPSITAEPFASYLKRVTEMTIETLGAYNKAEGEILELAKSREVATHEAGHAALATLKPGLWTPLGGAVHEGYGDLLSFFTGFDRQEAALAACEETGGDLSKSSSLTRLAEEFASYFARFTRDEGDDDWSELREMANSLTVEDVPALASPFDASPHSQSRVFSGATVEIFAAVAKMRIDALGANPSDGEKWGAIKQARDETARLVHQMLVFLPENGGFFWEDLAGAYMKADEIYTGGALREVMTDVFVRRGFISSPDEEPMCSSTECVPAVSVQPSITGLELMKDLGRASMAQVMERLNPSYTGRMKLIEDVVDAKGIRVVRFQAGTVKLDHRGHQIAPGQSCLMGREVPNIGSLVFSPEGELIAVNRLLDVVD